jgi:cytochrome c oxidase subunit I
MVPRAAGGRLYSDTLGSLTFILSLVFPCPSDFTICTPARARNILEVAPVDVHRNARAADAADDFHHPRLARNRRSHRGGAGLLGWVTKLPWDQPLVLAVGQSLAMLVLAGSAAL